MPHGPFHIQHRRNLTFHRSALCALCAVLLLSTAAAGQETAADTGWVSLFNGKDLDGWKIKITGHDIGDNFARTFRVEDGLLKVRYDGYEKFDEQFGHLTGIEAEQAERDEG